MDGSQLLDASLFPVALLQAGEELDPRTPTSPSLVPKPYFQIQAPSPNSRLQTLMLDLASKPKFTTQIRNPDQRASSLNPNSGFGPQTLMLEASLNPTCGVRSQRSKV